MSLRLIERIATQLRADAHGVIDAIEERSLLAKQHLRDAELELLQKRGRLEALRDEEERLQASQERLGARERALDADVELALAGDKEDLARFAVRQLIPVRRDLAAGASALAEVRAARTELAARFDEQERELESLRERVRAELARSHRRDESGAAFAGPAVAEEEVELELLRRREAGSA